MQSFHWTVHRCPDQELQLKVGGLRHWLRHVTGSKPGAKPTQLLQTLTRSSSVAELCRIHVFQKSHLVCRHDPPCALDCPRAKAAYFKPETDCLARPSCHVPIEINYIWISTKPWLYPKECHQSYGAWLVCRHDLMFPRYKTESSPYICTLTPPCPLASHKLMCIVRVQMIRNPQRWILKSPVPIRKHQQVGP